MQTISLTSLCGGECQEVFVPVKKQITYAVPIPEDIEFLHQTPEDIRKFITRIHTNMRVFLISKVCDMDKVDEIISRFTIYILENSKDRLINEVFVKGVPRYTMYDPITWTKVPYFKWFLSNLYYFYLSYIEEEEETKAREFPILNSSEHESFKGVRLDTITQSQKTFANPFDSIVVKELDSFLRVFSENHGEKFCFESKCYFLFQNKLQGTPNKDIAKSLNITQSAVSQWTNKLKILIHKYLDNDLDAHMQEILLHC